MLICEIPSMCKYKEYLEILLYPKDIYNIKEYSIICEIPNTSKYIN